jgi:hypothetical protein
MNDDEIARRKGLTFEQAEGIAPLPTQLRRTDVTPELRAVLWDYVYERIEGNIRRVDGYRHTGETWSRLLKAVHVYRDHRSADEFSSRFTEAIKSPKRTFEKGDYAQIYGWLQFVLQQKAPAGFAQKIEELLRYCHSPYRVVDQTVLCPIGSDQEAATLKQAFLDAQISGLSGSRKHLRLAATELGSGNFADSVRESIHAVESAVRVLEPSGDFSKALAKLEQKSNIHGALKKGFLALYGFSSDEQGIRHPLLDKEAPAVDEADAMFMIGACSAFISYLVNKSRSAGSLIEPISAQ